MVYCDGKGPRSIVRKTSPKKGSAECNAIIAKRTKKALSSKETRLKISNNVKKHYDNMTKNEKEKRSLNLSRALKGKTGGVRKGGGRGKSGWYKDYWCDSSWELAYVIYNLEHGIKFERNKQGFEYEFEGETFRYYPDFIMEDGSYTEVKGYMDKKNEAKHQQFNGVLNVLEEDEMKPYLDYVIHKYGKYFIKLYKE